MTSTQLAGTALERAESILADVRVSIPTLRGSMIASLDGRPLAVDLDREGIGAAAAVIASSFALGIKLAELNDSKVVEEVVVKTDDGYIALFAAGHHGVLGLLTLPGVNLGLLNLRARQAARQLKPLVPNLIAETSSA